MSSIDYKASTLEREIEKLELENGIVPFNEWFDSLGDGEMWAAVARNASTRSRVESKTGLSPAMLSGIFIAIICGCALTFGMASYPPWTTPQPPDDGPDCPNS